MEELSGHKKRVHNRKERTLGLYELKPWEEWSDSPEHLPEDADRTAGESGWEMGPAQSPGGDCSVSCSTTAISQGKQCFKKSQTD